jgi:hypothetical protein
MTLAAFAPGPPLRSEIDAVPPPAKRDSSSAATACEIALAVFGAYSEDLCFGSFGAPCAFNAA